MKRILITILMILGGTLWSAQLVHSAVHQSLPTTHGGTTQTANDAFDHIDDDPETGYVDGANYGDGCYARALIACEKLEKWVQDQGHSECSVMTAFAYDSDGVIGGGPCTLSGPGVSWGWHQICVLRCENEGGQWEDWYLDPALEDGPVSEQDWLQGFCSGSQPPDLEVRSGPRSGPRDRDPTVEPWERKSARKEIKARNP